jgi:hypothetical protein
MEAWEEGVLMVVVKSKVINKAIQDIGMGRYNWELFVLCGFGWFADKCVPTLLPYQSKY